ncbi:MAG: hypothetical protein RI564_00990 [Gracilimonas sp.]|nr:hypothetical protein [Gracilimonas sp.]
MKKLMNIGFQALFFLLITSGSIFGQYDFDIDLNNNMAIIDRSEIPFVHKGAPDKLINKTEIEITVEIFDAKGNRYKGLLKSDSISTTDKLPSGEDLWLNHEELRRGIGPQHKVEVVLTIPGVINSNDQWDLKQVKWNLGKDHNPTYTKLNYLGRQDGYQIIFVYENGLRPRELEDSEEHKLFHFNGHFCEPTEPDC